MRRMRGSLRRRRHQVRRPGRSTLSAAPGSMFGEDAESGGPEPRSGRAIGPTSPKGRAGRNETHRRPRVRPNIQTPRAPGGATRESWMDRYKTPGARHTQRRTGSGTSHVRSIAKIRAGRKEHRPRRSPTMLLGLKSVEGRRMLLTVGGHPRQPCRATDAQTHSTSMHCATCSVATLQTRTTDLRRTRAALSAAVRCSPRGQHECNRLCSKPAMPTSPCELNGRLRSSKKEF